MISSSLPTHLNLEVLCGDDDLQVTIAIQVGLKVATSDGGRKTKSESGR